jgi:uncharacterized protein with beta-barrel porin domain
MALGTLAMNAGANMQLEIAPEKDHCSLYVAQGDVTLGGATLNVTLTQNANNYPANQTYTFITTTSVVSGTFGVVNLPPGFVSFVDYSNPQATVLHQISTSQIGAGVHLSHNEREVLVVLQKLSKVSTLQSIFVDLSFSTPDELRASLDSISPARNAAVTFFANQVFLTVSDTQLGRLTEGRMLRHMREKSLKKKPLSVALLTKFENLTAMVGEAPMPSVPADLQEDVVASGTLKKRGRQPAGKTRTAAVAQENYGFWATGFGEFITTQEQHKNPEIHDTAAGAILGFSYYGLQNGIFSAQVGYVHNRISEDSKVGGGEGNGYNVGVYGTGNLGKGYIEGGLLLGWNFFDVHRRIAVLGPFPFKDTASSSFTDLQCMPHLGGGYDWMMDWGVVEPFGSLDWVIGFQESYREKGALPLNMHVKSQMPSTLRSQIGINFYENWDFCSCLLICQQKVSYVNQSFFNTNVDAAIILAPGTFPNGSPGSFEVLSYDAVLNLAGVGAELFYKHKRSGFFVSGTYRGEFGISYVSNDVTGTLGVLF